MTTVVYNKDKIYTDRRGIFIPTLWHGAMSCLDCGSIHYGNDNFVKIETEMFQNGLTKYEGSKIVAVAGAGDFDTFKSVTRLLRREFSLDLLYEFKTFATPINGKECNLLIVTEDKVHAIWFSNLFWQIKGSMPREAARNNPKAVITMGSGRDFAQPAVTLFGADGLDAIRFASLSDAGTSSSVTELDCQTLIFRQHDPMPVNEIKKRFARFARNINKE